MNEELLIIHCKENNRLSQKQLYEKYANKMFRLCYRYINNQHDAEDVMITGFFKVFNHIDKFEYHNFQSFEKWIKTIMINECLMWIRKKKKNQIVSIENVYNLQLNDPNVNFHVIEKIDPEAVYQIVANMPLGYRTIFNLFEIEGYSHKEIAEKLGISVNTSMSQLNRAKTYLKNKLRIE